MTITTVLVANRGEIAVRLLRAAAEAGLKTVAVYSEDDAESLHVKIADVAHPLAGAGVPAYLDIEQLVEAAQTHGADAVHPGYGFLSENTTFASRCEDAGIAFIGPTPDTLSLFGDKVRARDLARELEVPVMPGTGSPTTLEDARRFLASLPAGATAIVKAVGGGGGRGMRIVRSADEVEDALSRASAEAAAAFGNGDVYLEQFIEAPRHIEVQVVGDGLGGVVALGDRDCSIQRRHQKLIEIAPSPHLPEGLRDRITSAAVRMAAHVDYRSLGTFEFLVDSRELADDADFAFIEANPRLQVEHTVTEEVMGIDLVQTQLAIAGGAALGELGLGEGPRREPRGFAIQARVNMEVMTPEGDVLPGGGLLTAFSAPSGPGLRTDSFGYSGYRTSPRYDSLLAKVIAHTTSPDFGAAATKTVRALAEFRIEGVETNRAFLQAILCHPDFRAGNYSTNFIENHLPELLREAAAQTHVEYVREAPRYAGARVDASDPLAVLTHGGAGPRGAGPAAVGGLDAAGGQDGSVVAHLQGTVVSVEVSPGAEVTAGQLLLVMEAMKMQHEITAPHSGIVRRVNVEVGDTIYAGHVLALVEAAEITGAGSLTTEEVDLDFIRPDLAEVQTRRSYTDDAARPEAIEKRHSRGLRTARENIADLCDPGTFVEYGGLTLPMNMVGQIDEIARRYPHDAMINGIGSVNGRLFDKPASECVVMSYDYTVLAGTQGGINHRKTDRMLEIAGEWSLPVVLFTEGGGGRAGGNGNMDAVEGTGGRAVGPADTPIWRRLGVLSGQVPLVGVNSGFSFAGNAALLGCCDVIIATANSSIGMGGPAMIEGGNLGVFRPEEVAPMSVQVPNGVVDIAVADEAEAVAAAKQYLSYFQGAVRDWESPDQRVMRRLIPENRLRAYSVRDVIETMADVGSVLELRPQFGKSMVTSLVRIEGRPVGVIANNAMHQSGAIESDGADKAARFMQLCDAFDLPIVSLCDTPGIMVGPEAEKTALVRHSARMFVVGSNLTVPMVTVVLRKAYGLGAMTMSPGTFKSTAMTVAWPTGEFGGMGLEGMVKLGFRQELASIEDPAARKSRYDELVERAYQRGKALTAAVSFGVDDVIDPADTRALISTVFGATRYPEPRVGRKKRTNVDTW